MKTGDSARFDHNGWLCMLDRADDRAISNGFEIDPAEAENVIAAETPCAMGVRDAGSFGGGEGTCGVLFRSSSQLRAAGHDRAASRPAAQGARRKIKRKELLEPFWVGRERRVAANRRTRAAASALMSQGGDSFHRRRSVL